MNVDITQMIEDRQLGSLEAEYTGEKPTVRDFIILIGITLIISLVTDLLLTIFANHPDYSLFLSNLLQISAFIAGMFILTALGMVLSTLGIHVFLCTEGLLYVRWNKSKSIHWKSIHQVWLDVLDDSTQAFPVSHFKIISRDGRSFTFRDPGGNLLRALKARSTQHSFPVIETFNGKVIKRT
jgi:hypothetical protein